MDNLHCHHRQWTTATTTATDAPATTAQLKNCAQTTKMATEADDALSKAFEMLIVDTAPEGGGENNNNSKNNNNNTPKTLQPTNNNNTQLPHMNNRYQDNEKG